MHWIENPNMSRYLRRSLETLLWLGEVIQGKPYGFSRLNGIESLSRQIWLVVSRVDQKPSRNGGTSLLGGCGVLTGCCRLGPGWRWRWAAPCGFAWTDVRTNS